MYNAVTNVTGTFDGIDDYVVADITSAPALDLSNNYTFEAWVNRKKPIFGRIFDKSRINLFVHT
jgi:hypothetical protein